MAARIRYTVRVQSKAGRIFWVGRVNKSFDELQQKYLEETGRWLADYIKRRVRVRGQGAGGIGLKGYSVTPVTINVNGKPKREPAGGLPRRYQGGYRAYRKDVGLQDSHFALHNTGAAWGNFKAFAEQGRIDIGFTDQQDAEAAEAAIANGREEMLAVDGQELDMLAERALKSITKLVWASLFTEE
jgi:hypothetical protein